MQTPDNVEAHGTSAESGASEGGESNGNVSKPISTPTVPATIDTTADLTSVKIKKARERPSMKSLQIRGTSYHCVNWSVLPLSLLLYRWSRAQWVPCEGLKL